MSQQNHTKKVLVSFPPVHQLIKRYNSNSTSTSNLHEPSQPLRVNRVQSLMSHKSSISLRSLNRPKMSFESHLFGFEKELKFSLSEKIIKKGGPCQSQVQQIKRELDKRHVLDTYKRLIEPKINPRFLQKRQTLFRISDYQSFSPFKRNYEITRSVPKNDTQRPEMKLKKSSLERK